MELKYFYKIEDGKLIRGTGFKVPEGFIEYDKDNPPSEFLELYNEELFNKTKDEKIKEINNIAQEKIVSGFISSALGSEHLYQSEPTDQINLLGVVQDANLTGDNQFFKCSPDNGQTWEYKEHTPEQITQVLKDGKTIKSAILEKANELKLQVNNATTIDEINAVTWDE
ncbi:hypothetical protein C3L23_06040 [Nautilia sp. PV-1]|uniref:DUF4376 domain-containing protein n=1 Tax=Nautilia sp. PV-1 TaxID=2579250 RepID=UPI000FD87545|nr:DUF4376 domain-containing protein [Nautilia sp. PV-1]AZV46846.1 hypothetical protein C3L23_06040 [Nautilia sp. PV-1]